MPVAARSDERGSRHRPFPGAQPPRQCQSTARVHRRPTAFATAVKVSNDRMRGTQFSSYNPVYHPNECSESSMRNQKLDVIRSGLVSECLSALGVSSGAVRRRICICNSANFGLTGPVPCLQNCQHKPRSATADPSTHHPQTEKRLGPLSLRMTGHLTLWDLGTEHGDSFCDSRDSRSGCRVRRMFLSEAAMGRSARASARPGGEGQGTHHGPARDLIPSFHPR